MNECDKTSAFSFLKQYYNKLSFNFIIYSDEKSFSVYTSYIKNTHNKKNLFSGQKTNSSKIYAHEPAGIFFFFFNFYY